MVFMTGSRHYPPKAPISGWQVVSRFGARSLVTSNSSVVPLPAEVLRQQVAGGRPAEIIRAHDAALTLLSGRAVRPRCSRATATHSLHRVSAWLRTEEPLRR
jgi:hypothetical protein